MPENEPKYQDRLLHLRKEMKKQTLDGYIVPHTDEFQGEFLPKYAQRLGWMTGFTGSAGAAIVLHENAVVMSDGRYTIQLAQEVDAQLYEYADSTKITIGDWLNEHACEGMNVGYDVWLHTPKQIEDIVDKLAGTGVVLVPIAENIIDTLWHDQPKKPNAPVTLFPEDVAGKSAKQKRMDIAQDIKEQGAQACLITAGDSICWLLNVRGGDVDYSPLILSYIFLYEDGRVDWFVDEHKISSDIKSALGEGVNLHDFNAMEERIEKINGSILYDSNSAPIWFEQAVVRHDVELIAYKDPCSLPKSIKSQAEQEAIRQSHIHDGVAIVKFMKWVDENAGKGELTELSVEEQLESFRKEHDSYLYPSFSTIAGFAENGAIIHYRASEKTCKIINRDSLLLVDSGGQYQWGTTDITRTICIGVPTQEMRENYTRVLKGHIAVSVIRFKKGTTGKEIDALARVALQEVGLDYAHGTGHGVGCFLGVHEAAANLSPRSEAAVEAGMLLSNEPGYYKAGEYGIRIENLILAKQALKEPNMLCFETVTLAPYDKSLIDVSLLNETEQAWLAAYEDNVRKKLVEHLSKNEKEWLFKA